MPYITGCLLRLLTTFCKAITNSIIYLTHVVLYHDTYMPFVIYIEEMFKQEHVLS